MYPTPHAHTCSSDPRPCRRCTTPWCYVESTVCDVKHHAQPTIYDGDGFNLHWSYEACDSNFGGNTWVGFPSPPPAVAAPPDTPSNMCVPSSTAREGDLTGTHLNIVTVEQPGFTNMYAANGSLLPSAQWTGYFPDLIQWIATQSGMTYTLYAPSGTASNCTGASAGNYGCGQKDVTELGLRDMYMGLYYVTPARLQAGLMTRSFTGDAGTPPSARVAQHR